MAECVKYFRTIKTGKIVLMGHSTGCQDVMEYLTGPGHEFHPPVNGGILQAPVSDREAIVASCAPEVYARACRIAEGMVNEGKGEDIMPLSETQAVFLEPCCARRWLSLASPNHDGDEDFFSSDLTNDQLMKSFGKLPVTSPLCILISGDDEHVPTSIDKDGLLQMWGMAIDKGQGKLDLKNSSILDGASHNLQDSPGHVVTDLVTRVVSFIEGLV